MIDTFSNFRSFEDLHSQGWSHIPNEKGVYLVCSPLGFQKIITPTTTAITEYRGDNLLYCAEVLESKWIDDCRILYIGKAGGDSNRLRQRIGQFVKYGYAEVDNHRGGRAIWQLENNKSLLIGYRLYEQPRQLEESLIIEFENLFNRLPFANFRH